MRGPWANGLAGPILRFALAPDDGRRFVLALAVSLAGRAAFHAPGLLPWMLGATFLATVAAIAGLPVAIPAGARSLMMAVLGSCWTAPSRPR